ncbi:hypothetical protein Tco_1430829 [Tanacetum coccineum]
MKLYHLFWALLITDLSSKMKDAVNVAIQAKIHNKLREEAQAENDKFLKQIDSNIRLNNKVQDKSSSIQDPAKRGRGDQDKDEEPFVGSNSKRKRSDKEESSKEATQKESKSTTSSKGASRSQPKSSGKSAQAEEHGLRVDDLEEPLHQEFNTRDDDVSLVREIIAVDERLHNEKFSGIRIPLLEEVFKATHDQLDWHNPEGRSYHHDLSKPLPLIQNARGRQVIPFDHFINNDLEYLKGGSLSQRYITSITKTKAADYGYLQLSVESYQKKINLSKPDSYHSDLRKMTLYTAYLDIQGIIYKDDMDINCLMRTDELHKFSDGTLNHVRTALNDIATRIQMEYLLKRKWSKQDK